MTRCAAGRLRRQALGGTEKRRDAERCCSDVEQRNGEAEKQFFARGFSGAICGRLQDQNPYQPAKNAA